MKRILFISTYKARDFLGHALIGWYLKRNYDIDSFYVNGYNIIPKILKYRPQLLIVNTSIL